MSLTHMATQSMPTVSCTSIRKAIFSFVPTPSVPLTSTGLRNAGQVGLKQAAEAADA